MGYHMRYVLADDRRLDLAAVETALKGADPHYEIAERTRSGGSEVGMLKYGRGLYAEVAIEAAGDGFAADIEHLREEAAATRGRKRPRVLELLAKATQVLRVRVMWQDRPHEDTLSRLDPLWSWLAANHDGLVHADGEGFYDGMGPVLRTK